MRTTWLLTGAVLLLVAGCGGESPRAAAPSAPVSSPSGAGGQSGSAVEGVVRDAAGLPVAGVLVAAVALGGGGPVPDLGVVTDAAGRYRWPAVLAEGRYRLQAQTAEGAADAEVLVSKGSPAQVDLQVRPR